MNKAIVFIFSLTLCTATSAATIDIAPQQPTAQAAQHTISQAPLPRPTIAAPLPPKIVINAKSWVLLDYQTGKVLSQHNDQQRLPPASLTKLMTAYVVLQALHNGTTHLTDKVLISPKAAKTGGSRMFIRAGKKISVENLMKGMIIASGNDATVALAQHIAGSESAFAHMMNQVAAQLDMDNSHFVNPNGLPAKDQYVSAQDMATLSRALISHFPKAYHWYSQKSFTWSGIKQHSRNRLLWTNPNVDGLKTGYTKAAKYCLVASAKQGQMRLIGVILGAPSAKARAAEMQTLLTYGFRFYQNKTLYHANQTVQAIDVANGAQKTVNAIVTKSITVTIPRGHERQLTARLTVKPLTAPIKKDQVIGQLHIAFNGKPILTQNIIAQNAVAKASLWQKVKNWF